MINTIRVVGVGLFGLLLLTGCGSIGDGTAPSTMTIIETSDLETRSGQEAIDLAPGSGFALTCMAKQLQALVRFSDGQIGSFSERATWTSSDPSVVEVTNSLETEIPGDPDFFLPAGLLLPVAAGTAQITAEYLTLKETFDVTVTAIDANSYQITGLEGTMAPASTSVLGAEVTEGGETRDASGNTRFVLVNPTDELEELVGLAPEGSLNVLPIDSTVTTLPFSFSIQALPIVPLPACEALIPVATIRVDRPISIDIDYQDNFYGAGAAAGEDRLVRGFTQTLQATANFADVGDGSPLTQDVSNDFAMAYQVQPEGAVDCNGAFDETSTDAPSSAIGFGNFLLRQGNVVTGIEVGDARVCARYGSVLTDQDDFIDASGSLTFSTVPGLEDDTDPTQLDAITITPANATLDDFRETVDFSARADFTLADTTTLSQSVTPDVLWTVDSDNSSGEELRVAEITNSNNSLTPGRAISALPLGELPAPVTVNVNATIVFGGALDPVDEPVVDDFRVSVPLTVSVPDLP